MLDYAAEVSGQMRTPIKNTGKADYLQGKDRSSQSDGDGDVPTPTVELSLVFDKFLAASPKVAQHLANRPWSFFFGHAYINHLQAVLTKARWWQFLLAILLFFVIGYPEFRFGEIYGEYAMGLLAAPVVEETIKALSLRTWLGRRMLGGGFAIGFPVVEAVVFGLRIVVMAPSGVKGIVTVLMLERLAGVFLHLYTHFVQTYGLSVFGRKRRVLGSFCTAIGIHSVFNGLTSLVNLLLV